MLDHQTDFEFEFCRLVDERQILKLQKILDEPLSENDIMSMVEQGRYPPIEAMLKLRSFLPEVFEDSAFENLFEDSLDYLTPELCKLFLLWNDRSPTWKILPLCRIRFEKILEIVERKYQRSGKEDDRLIMEMLKMEWKQAVWIC